METNALEVGRLVGRATIVVALLGLACAGRALRAGQQPATAQAGARSAVAAARFIEDAEAQYHTIYGSYAGRRDLIASGIPAKIFASMTKPSNSRPGMIRPPDLGSSTPVPGYDISIFVDASGSHLLVSLVNQGKGTCLPSFYADQTGIIRQAKALGCK